MPDLFETLAVEGPPFWRAVFFAGVGLQVLALVWLAVRAFDEGAGWGIGVVLLPVLVIPFAIKYWDRARGPIGAMVIAAALVLVPQRFEESDRSEAEAESGGALKVYGSGPVYQYTDGDGRVQLVETLDQVPARFRASAKRLDPEPAGD
jgi:hypothetical protein